MSVVGIDLGTSYCVLATVKNGTITIIRNDLSERLTPALVSYTAKERLVGEVAQTQIRSNLRNTARYIKQIVGGSEADERSRAHLEFESEYALAPIVTADDQQFGYRVNYMGEERVFGATSVLAALLGQLRDTAARALGAPVRDVVINCPSWYSDCGRQAVRDAAEIAGLNCTRVMSEHAAIALDYGIYRAPTFNEAKAKRVAFVSVGHGTSAVSIADFKSNELRVIASVSDRRVGGRVYDRCIVAWLAQTFRQKYGLDPLGDRKALMKLEDAANKAKKVLSANSEAPISVECLMEDEDLSVVLTREEFENLCAEPRARFTAVLAEAFQQGGVPVESVESLEIVGGCTRIPFVQRDIAAFFRDLPLSRTLNMDETVARGCALQAAILDPRYRVREFKVNDLLLGDITVSWDSTASETGVKEHLLFERGTVLGSKRWLTFSKSATFDIRVGGEQLAVPMQYTVVVPPVPEAATPGAPVKVKVRARLTCDGIVVLEDAQLTYEVVEEYKEKEKRVVEEVAAGGAGEAGAGGAAGDAAGAETAEGAAGDAGVGAGAGGEDGSAAAGSAADGSADGPAAASAQKYTEVLVTKTRTLAKSIYCELRLAPRAGYLEASTKAKLVAAEEAMLRNDRECQAAKESMNTLESFIYAARENIEGAWKPFIASPGEKSAILERLDAAQEWVYANFDTATRGESQEKYDELLSCTSSVSSKYEAEVAAARKAEEEREAAAAAAAAAAKAEAAAAAAAAEATAPSATEDVPMAPPPTTGGADVVDDSTFPPA